MALGAGHNARCGIGLESLAGTWGTLVAPTILVPFTTESLNIGIEWLQNNTLIDKLGQESPTKVGETISGGLQARASYRNSEYLIYAAMAGVEAKTEAASPYTHTFDLGSTWTRDMSIILEKDVSCWNITGAKINSFTLNSSHEGVYWDMDIIGKLCTLATTHRTALDALTYSESNPMIFHHHLVFRIGDTVDALADGDIVNVSDLSLSLNSKLQTDLYTSTSGQNITEPQPNGKPELTLSLTMPRLEATTLIDAHKAGTKLQADIVYTGGTCGAGTYGMTINLPTAYITEAPTAIGGEEMISVPITCQCVRNDSNSNMAEVNAMELILKNAGDSDLEWTA